MPKYFKKELPETPLYLSVGSPVQFEYIDLNGYGYLRTEDGFVINELYRFIARGTGGVTEIDEAEWNDFQAQKKSESSKVSLQRQRPTLGAKRSTHLDQNRGVDRAGVASAEPSVLGRSGSGEAISAAATNQRSEGLKVTDQFVKPRVGKAERPQ